MKRGKVTDKQVDEALLAYWREQGPGDDVKRGYGAGLRQVRRLVGVFREILTDVERALANNDARALRRALDRSERVTWGKQGRYQVFIDEALEDARDVLLAMEGHLL